MSSKTRTGVTETELGYVHFGIDFDFLTNTIREAWMDGRYSWAREVFDDLHGLPPEMFAEVVMGRKKFVQDPDGAKGGSGMIADDNWEPVLAQCKFGVYPDPDTTDWTVATEIGLEYRKKYLDMMVGIVKDGVENMSSDQYTAVIDYLRSIDSEVFSHMGWKKDEYISRLVRKERELKLVNTYVSSTLEADKKELSPEGFVWQRQANPLSGEELFYVEGWISPGGLWYPHLYGQHAQIESRLVYEIFGFDAPMGFLYSKGWLTVHAPGILTKTPPMVSGTVAEITVAQADELGRWAEIIRSHNANPDEEWIDVFQKAAEGHIQHRYTGGAF